MLKRTSLGLASLVAIGVITMAGGCSSTGSSAASMGVVGEPTAGCAQKSAESSTTASHMKCCGEGKAEKDCSAEAKAQKDCGAEAKAKKDCGDEAKAKKDCGAEKKASKSECSMHEAKAGN